jgi:hypothetical protein
VYLNIITRLDIDYDQALHVFLYPENMELALWEVLPMLSLYNLTSAEVHVYYGGVDNHGQIEHEMVHAMTAQLDSFRGSPELPALLIEGLAEYIVNDPWGVDLDLWVSGFMKLGLYIPLTMLWSDEAFRQNNQVVTYETAGSFVRYLIEQYGLTRFKALYRQPSFHSVYGTHLQELENEWSARIHSVDATPDTVELIAFRVRLAELYQDPALLRKVPWVGIHTTPSQERIVIDGVTENSPAMKNDLQCGDEIIGVSGTQINAHTVWRIYALLLDRQADDVLTFTLKRNETIITREVILLPNPNRIICS